MEGQRGATPSKPHPCPGSTLCPGLAPMGEARERGQGRTPEMAAEEDRAKSGEGPGKTRGRTAANQHARSPVTWGCYPPIRLSPFGTSHGSAPSRKGSPKQQHPDSPKHPPLQSMAWHGMARHSIRMERRNEQEQEQEHPKPSHAIIPSPRAEPTTPEPVHARKTRADQGDLWASPRGRKPQNNLLEPPPPPPPNPSADG